MRSPYPQWLSLSALLVVGCGGGQAEPAQAADPSAGSEQYEPREEAEPEDDLQVAGLRGTLSQDEVQMALEPRMLKFANCVAKRTRHVDMIAGGVGLAFVVKTDGSVRSVVLTDSNVGDRVAERCILKVARKIRFPDPHGGEAEFGWSFEVPLDPEVRPAVPWAESDAASVIAEHGAAVSSQCGAGFKVTVYVDTDGSVLAAGVVSQAEADEAALDCVSEAVGTWTFPTPGSYPAKLSFSL